MTQKILLDTDIGSDIDDAVALAYLLAQPECELLGITTVSGEVKKRACIASALCRAVGRDIPIYAGRDKPALVEQRQLVAQQARALTGMDYQENFTLGEAVPFMRQVIRQHPGEVILLSIGPLTNVAALFLVDEEIPSLLKGMVSMCGTFTHNSSGGLLKEWNAMLDPHASAVVYASRLPFHRSIGLDVTLQVEKDTREVNQLFSRPGLQPVLDFARVWFEENPSIVFHDPLAAVSLFDPAVCRFERGCVDIELDSPRLAGLAHWKPDPTGRHEVALGVDPTRFFESFLSVFPQST
jgi:purine nucleosidase